MFPRAWRNNLLSTVVTVLILCASISLVESSSTDGRHSFSLTTFDPSGKLGQVERAMVAASLGTPVVAIVKGNDHILLASPQVLPSMFMLDDGTARFASVAPHIVVAHSGISADGRVLVAAAQRLAVEHTFTFEEPIPIDLFLEEMSLLLQEYTMKPGSRPFGTTLLVAHLPSVEADKERQPQLYRIDASGSVTVVVNNVAVLNTRFSGQIESKLLQMVENSKHEPKEENDELKLLCQMLEESILDKEQPGKISLPLSVIGAAFTRKGGLELQKFRSKV